MNGEIGTYLGHKVIVNDFMPKDKIIIRNNNEFYVHTINYSKLVYETTDNLMEAVGIIARFTLDKLYRRIESVFSELKIG